MPPLTFAWPVLCKKMRSITCVDATRDLVNVVREGRGARSTFRNANLTPLFTQREPGRLAGAAPRAVAVPAVAARARRRRLVV